MCRRDNCFSTSLTVMVKRPGTEQIRPNMEYFPGCDWLEICRDTLKKTLLIRVVSSCRLPSHSVCQALMFVVALAHAHHPLYAFPPLTRIIIAKLFSRAPVMRPLKPLPGNVDLIPIEAVQGHVAGREGGLSLDNQ